MLERLQIIKFVLKQVTMLSIVEFICVFLLKVANAKFEYLIKGSDF